MRTRTQNARNNILTGVISKIVSLMLPFITRTCIIYYLGTVYLGLNSLFSSILQILSLAELGFGEAMVFSMYRPLAEDNQKKIRALLNLYKKIYRIIGIVVLAVGLALMPFLDRLIKDSASASATVNIYTLYLIYLINTVLSYLLFAYKGSLLAAHQRVSITNIINMVTQTIMSLAQILIIVTTRNYYIYVIVIPLFTIFRNLATEMVTRKLYPDLYCEGKLDKDEIKEIEKKVAGLFIYKICGTFRNSFDSIVISAFLGLVVLAKYENYYYIVNSIIGALSIISNSITASVGNSIVSESKEKNRNDFFKFLFVYEWITGLCTVCLYCLYQPFMRIWVGEDLMLGNGIVYLLCIYFFVLKSGDICYVYRQAAGIWWKDKFRPIIEAISNLILNLILVKYFGVGGVLLATIVTMLLINLTWGGKILFDVYFEQGLAKYFINIIMWAVATSVACIACSCVCMIIAGNGVAEFVMRMVISAIAPNFIFAILFCGKRKNRQYMSSMYNSIVKR